MRAALLALMLLLGACGDDDAPVAPADAGPLCGIAAPGTRCADVHTLERCAGTAVVSEDCAAQGKLCAADPGAEGGAACVATGDACGRIDELGACVGDTLAYCDSGTHTLQVSDCREGYDVCAFKSPSAGFACTNPCDLMNVTAAGTCTPEGLRHCEFSAGAYAVVVSACPAGSSCHSNVAETHSPQCTPDGACASVGPIGRCAGDVLTHCEGGTPTTTDCAAQGGVCSYAGGDAGYVCAAAGTSGAFVVTGTVRYQDRAPLPDGSLAELASQPARGVAVALVADADGSVLAAAVTADDGSYALHHDAAPGAMLHVLAATTSELATRPVRVLRPDGLVHGFGGASFAAAVTSVADLLVSDASGEAEAFNIFDQLVRTIDYARSELGVAAPVPLSAVWARAYEPETSQYFPGDHSIELLGSFDDDDGYDDTVILHESGHYVEDSIAHAIPVAGTHTFGQATDPLLAWSEGFATYWALAVRGDPRYMDSNVGGGFGVDADREITVAPTPTGNQRQNIAEDLVFQVLWDVADSAGALPDDDGFAGEGHGAVVRVQTEYLASGPGDRGVAGVDFVDWLDGFFVHAGLTACTGVRGVVTLDHKFPYDYAGPAGLCQP